MTVEYVREEHLVESALICDRCKTRHEDVLERQEYLRYQDTGGYGSVFGDMNGLQLDLCQHCVKEVLGSWIRIKPAWVDEYELIQTD